METSRNQLINDSSERIIVRKKSGMIGGIAASIALVTIVLLPAVLVFSLFDKPEHQGIILALGIGFLILIIIVAFSIVGIFAYYQTVFDFETGFIGRKTVFGKYKFYSSIGKVVGFEHEARNIGHGEEYFIYAKCESGRKLFTDEKSLEAANELILKLEQLLGLS